MDLLGILSAFGLSASAGLNAYIPLLVVALLGRLTNLIKLSEPWDALTSWWIIGLLAVLSLIEFLADSSPVINHVNDAIQTFVRPAAGAILFAASANVITEISPILSIAAGILVAGGVHAVKSLAIRPVVTASTGGAGNIAVAAAEDLTSTLVSIISVIVPALIAIVIIAVIAWVIWRRTKRQEAPPPSIDYV